MFNSACVLFLLWVCNSLNSAYISFTEKSSLWSHSMINFFLMSRKGDCNPSFVGGFIKSLVTQAGDEFSAYMASFSCVAVWWPMVRNEISEGQTWTKKWSFDPEESYLLIRILWPYKLLILIASVAGISTNSHVVKRLPEMGTCVDRVNNDSLFVQT